MKTGNQTDSLSSKRKSNRGGKRRGAGRKPKGHVSPSKVGGLDLRAAMAADVPESIESDAQRHARVAVDELVKIITDGASDSARVAACNAILDRGYGRPSVDSGVDMVLPFLGTAPSRSARTDIRSYARGFAQLAVAALAKIQTTSASESARVAAARSLLDRGLGTVAAARMTGKDLAAPPPQKPSSSWDSLVH